MNLIDSNLHGNGIQFFGFNQDYGCFAITTEAGFRVFNSDPLRLKKRRNFAEGGLASLEMLFRCNYVALVGGGAKPLYPPNKVVIYDDMNDVPTISMDFSSAVRGVRMRRDRIVIILEGIIKVFTFETAPKQLHVFETSPNPLGLCVVCPSSARALLGYPVRRAGHVQIVDLANTDRAPVEIGAHETTIACLAFNLDGTRLATASERGTLIRIFDTATGQRVDELRRGTNQAIIYSINFDRDSTRVCVASNHDTVHIFSLKPPVGSAPTGSTTAAAAGAAPSGGGGEQQQQHQHQHQHHPQQHQHQPGYGGGILGLVTLARLPQYLKSQWSCCKITLPPSRPYICAFGNDIDTLIVVCADGQFLKFSYTMKGDFSRDMCTQFLDLDENTPIEVDTEMC